ncbi:MAG TPA: hypothetical protein VFB99_09520 [Vicinamibacterales bacterium]|jgi:hypothetical protein|nr:hypothetical protein [Vicinamibacterales bacterium]
MLKKLPIRVGEWRRCRESRSGERAYEKQVAEARAKGLPIAPRTTGMEVYSAAPVEGHRPVRGIGFK